jgi:hypothetical protein
MKLIKVLFSIDENYKKSLSLHKDVSPNPVDSLDVNNKYASDTIIMMAGRSTGHFGSGTYFSTYRFEDEVDFERFVFNNKEVFDANKPFASVSKGLHLIDLDFYHLYKPLNREHADLLFETLKMINRLSGYYNTGLEKIDFSDVNTKVLLTKINYNLSKLDLKKPTLLEFARLFEAVRKDVNQKNSFASLSTRFMEYNGYNGVNVNNIHGYDNTLHGSVVYDLSKTINPNYLLKNRYHDDLMSEYGKPNITKIVSDINNSERLNSDVRFLSKSEFNLVMNLVNNLINYNRLIYSLKTNSSSLGESEDFLFNKFDIKNIYSKYLKRILTQEERRDLDYSTVNFMLSVGLLDKIKLDDNLISDIFESVYYKTRWLDDIDKYYNFLHKVLNVIEDEELKEKILDFLNDI